MYGDKDSIRKQVIAKCKSLSLEERQDFEFGILTHLRPLLKQAQSIAIYNAYAWELNLQHAIQFCQERGKDLYQPVAYRGERLMKLAKYGSIGSEVFSSPEYIAQHEMKWYNLDLLLIPLVAVDRRGFRLGKGGGYYDTTLSGITKKTFISCGIGFNCQKLAYDLPVDTWDLQLDYFASEQGLIKF